LCQSSIKLFNMWKRSRAVFWPITFGGKITYIKAYKLDNWHHLKWIEYAFLNRNFSYLISEIGFYFLWIYMAEKIWKFKEDRRHFRSLHFFERLKNCLFSISAFWIKFLFPGLATKLGNFYKFFSFLPIMNPDGSVQRLLLQSPLESKNCHYCQNVNVKKKFYPQKS
jgi:hypothetical protein